MLDVCIDVVSCSSRMCFYVFMWVFLVYCGSNVGWMVSGTFSFCAVAKIGSFEGWLSGMVVWVNGVMNLFWVLVFMVRCSLVVVVIGLLSDRWVVVIRCLLLLEY